jgi:hypothetical protein
MKPLITLFTICLLSSTTHAEDVAKSLVTLSVKKQVLEANHEMRGRQGETKDKTYTLRVEITNTSSTAITDLELTGDVLITRSTAVSDKLVKEPLGKTPVAPMKPNERITVDIGKITLHELELKNRKFEEKLEEWKVECLQKQIVIGSAVSSDQYAAREKEVVTPQGKKGGPGRKKGKLAE